MTSGTSTISSSRSPGRLSSQPFSSLSHFSGTGEPVILDRPDPLILKTPMWAHQRAAFDFAWDKPGAMLAMGLGCGKSKTTIDLIQNRDHDRILIIAPKRVHEEHTWQRQFALHSVRQFAFVDLTERSVAQAAATLLVQADVSHRFVVVVNYDRVWREPLAHALLHADWDLVVLDESHHGKAAAGRASKFLARLGTRVPWRLALSGTPMAHTPLDLYGQFRVLDPSILGTSYTLFKHRYARFENPYIPQKITGYQNEDELQRKFYQIAFKVGEEVLDLPPTHEITREFDLSPEARRIYRQLDRQMYTEVQSGECTPANAAVKVLRLHQVASGHLKRDDGVLEQVDTGKRDLLQDVLEDIAPGEPVVVFAWFRADLDSIQEACITQQRRYAELSGRRSDLATWARGDADVLGVQIQSGSEGLNDLVRARYAIYFSPGTSLKNWLQSRKRLHRPGQTRPVTYIRLIARNTKDQATYDALARNRDVIEAILATYQK